MIIQKRKPPRQPLDCPTRSCWIGSTQKTHATARPQIQPRLLCSDDARHQSHLTMVTAPATSHHRSHRQSSNAAAPEPPAEHQRSNTGADGKQSFNGTPTTPGEAPLQLHGSTVARKKAPRCTVGIPAKLHCNRDGAPLQTTLSIAATGARCSGEAPLQPQPRRGSIAALPAASQLLAYR